MAGMLITDLCYAAAGIHLQTQGHRVHQRPRYDSFNTNQKNMMAPCQVATQQVFKEVSALA